MSKSSCRRKRLRWVCPQCGGALLLDHQRVHVRACVTCVDDNGYPVLAQSVIQIDERGPLTRTARLSGVDFPSRYRATRKR